MIFRLQPRRDERAALLMQDLASAIDAGLPPASYGGIAADGDRQLAMLLPRRGIVLDAVEETVLVASWQSGRAPAALRRLAEQREQRAAFARTILSALRYPALLLFLSTLVSLIAARLGAAWLPFVIGSVLLALLLFGLWLRRAIATGNPAAMRLPLVGPLVAELGELPYLEVLHSLYASGVALLQAHPRAVLACGVKVVRDRLQLADALLQQGRPLHEALVQTLAVDNETLALLSTGEQIGNLEDSLLRAITRRRDSAKRRTKALAKGVGAFAYGLGVATAIAAILSFYIGYANTLRSLR
ncbi:MAG: type II secretion system F family protein [Planctomycetota bacterium]